MLHVPAAGDLGLSHTQMTSLSSPAPIQLLKPLQFLFSTIWFAPKPGWVELKFHTSDEDATTRVACFFCWSSETWKILATPGEPAVLKPSTRAGLPPSRPCGWNVLCLARSFKPPLPLQAGKCGRFGASWQSVHPTPSPLSCPCSAPGRQCWASHNTCLLCASGKEKGRGGKLAPAATVRTEHPSPCLALSPKNLWLHFTEKQAYVRISPCKIYLDMLLGDKPGSVSQHFVQFSQILQFLRCIFQAIQPFRVSTNVQEVIHVEVNKVRALMSGCSLEGKTRLWYRKQSLRFTTITVSHHFLKILKNKTGSVQRLKKKLKKKERLTHLPVLTIVLTP